MSKRRNGGETYLTDEEKAAARSEKVQKILKREMYNWKPIEYDSYKSVVYMTARMAANFAALKYVFNEIKMDDPSFEPKSLFDFGSGVGTTLWAAMDLWPKDICEYLAVDISSEAADIADLLLRRGDENNHPIFKNTLTRQFLPVSSHTKYDLVVCAYSLMELPSRSARINVLENLWHKTNDILVVVEHGKKGGFSVAMEARDLILQLTGHKVTETFKVDSSQRGVVSGDAENIPCSHTMAPCPHNFPCPKLFTGQVNPCNFKVAFNHLILPELRKHLWGTEEQFSYVIMRKKPLALKDTPPWPRIITKTKKKQGAVRCDLCCPNGTLQNVLVTKRYHEKSLHKIARVSKWSDLLPATVIEYFKSRDGRVYLESGYQSDPNYEKAVEKLMLLEGGKPKDPMIKNVEKNEGIQSEQFDSQSDESGSDSDDDGSSSDSSSSCEDDETHPKDSFDHTKRKWTINKS
ncbi:ribosome assembly protein METTL17, mitochondrial isoform X2 [Brevipalpus obovatus]